jgi:hypothetical protein
MIEIHNKSIYERAYNRFSSAFIREYTVNRQSGLSSRESVISARNALKDEVAEEMFKSPNHNQRVIIKAYNHVKKDTTLIEEAIKHYKRFKGKNSG